MKVITKIVIDIETGQVEEEHSYEYEGPIALCKGGGSNVTYAQSPEQAQLLSTIMPVVSRVASTAMTGQPLYQLPATYEIPAAEAVMPTTDWWKGIAPEVKQGLWAPYNEAADILTERLGATGGLGSARGGYSGSAAAGLGKLYSEAGKDVGLQAWQMTQPALAAQWQAELEREKGLYGLELARTVAPYQLISSLTGSAAQLTPTGMVQQSPSTASILGGGLMGAAMPAMMGMNPLWGIPMGLGAMMGGK